jgi:hypothetical protein
MQFSSNSVEVSGGEVHHSDRGKAAFERKGLVYWLDHIRRS